MKRKPPSFVHADPYAAVRIWGANGEKRVKSYFSTLILQTHTSLAVLIKRAGLLRGRPPGRPVSGACFPRGHQAIIQPAGPDRTSKPRGQMLISSKPNYRPLSAALLMSSSAVHSPLTALALQMDSTVAESVAGKSWKGSAVDGCICRVYGWMDKQASLDENAWWIFGFCALPWRHV